MTKLSSILVLDNLFKENIISITVKLMYLYLYTKDFYLTPLAAQKNVYVMKTHDMIHLQFTYMNI